MPPEASTTAITLKEFIETVPPGRESLLISSSFGEDNSLAPPHNYRLKLTPVWLHCSHPACDGMRIFEPSSEKIPVGKGVSIDVFLYFSCRNCTISLKSVAITLTTTTLPEAPRTAKKFGETPQFGPPLPAKLLQLAGEDGGLLKKGRQSENQSLGIGAFGYYRRVVEQQKSRLIDEIEKAVERLGGNPTAMAALEAAREERQFTKALEGIAAVTPKELFVGGQNPLALLHRPLSVGLHGLSDDECLKMAHNIRIVLSAMLERIQMVTEEKAELDAAIRELLKPE